MHYLVLDWGSVENSCVLRNLGVGASVAIPDCGGTRDNWREEALIQREGRPKPWSITLSVWHLDNG